MIFCIESTVADENHVITLNYALPGSGTSITCPEEEGMIATHCVLAIELLGPAELSLLVNAVAI